MENITNMFAFKLGEIWKRAREAKGWSQKEAATAFKEMKISDSEISLYESGKRVPNFERIVEMCETYGVDITDIAKLARRQKKPTK